MELTSKKRGFTLIELLVVISIISMLSSVVFAGVSVVREKGKIGGGILFDSANERALGINEIVRYEFEEGSGIPVNHGMTPGVTSLFDPSCSGCAYSAQRDTPLGSGYSYVFSEDVGIAFEMNSPVVLTDYTISLWVKPSGIVPNNSAATMFNAGCYGFPQCTTVVNGQPVILYLNHDGSVYNKIAFNNNMNPIDASIPFGKWTHIAVSYKAKSGVGGTFNYYLNGHQISGPIDTTDSLNSGGVITYIYMARKYMGSVDNITFYPERLTAGDVRHIYARELTEQKFVVR